ncbi:MAG: hypothetical protein RIR79_2358 [Pseudomonadota bacterium]
MTTTTTPPTFTTPAPTFDDVWRALMETRQMIKENAEAVRIRFEQEDARRAEEARLRAEEARLRLEREAEETRLRSEREAEEAKRRTEEAQKRAEEEIKREQQREQDAKKRAEEAQKRFEDNEKRSKELDRRLGALGNRLGDFVQEMVRPAAVRLFQERNLPVHQVIANQVAYDDHRQFVMEIDLIVINTDVLIAIECKSNLSHDDVQEHLERLDIFKQHFPQYRGYKILGAVAGMVIPPEVARYAHKKGLYVLAQSGEAVEIRNPSGFKPHEW